MGRCTICQHANRAAIDQAVTSGQPLAQIASLHGVGDDALRRHKKHIPASLAVAAKAAEVSQADDLLAKVNGYEADARRIAASAEAGGDLRTALQGIHELVRIVELMAKLRGELDERAVVNVALVQAPEWVTVRSRLLKALDDFPEARLAVSNALSEASDG